METYDTKKYNKKECQDKLKAVQDMMLQYARAYPKSVSDCISKYMKIFLIPFIIFGFILVEAPGMNDVFGFIVCGIGIVMLMKIWQIKRPKNPYDDRGHTSIYDTCMEQIGKYADFPDVKKYADTINPTLQHLYKQKTMYKIVAIIIFVIYVALLAVYLYAVFYKK